MTQPPDQPAEPNAPVPTADDAPQAPESQPAKRPARKTRRRRRRWPWVVLATLLVLIVGVVALAPTLLSTGPGTRLVENAIDGQINGDAALQRLSLGWFSGAEVEGLKVYDPQGREVLDVARLDTELSLWNAVTGNLAFGDSTAVVNLTRVETYPDGTTNYHQIFNLTPSDEQSEPSAGNPLENISINLTATLGATIQDAQRQVPVSLAMEEGKLVINDGQLATNLPIDFRYGTASEPAGRVSLVSDIQPGPQTTADVALTIDQLAGPAVAELLTLVGVQDVNLTGPINGTAALLYDGSAKPEESLRNLAIDLESNFATVSGGGKEIGSIDLTATADVEKLGPVLQELFELPLSAGQFATRLTTQRQLTPDGPAIVATLDTDLANPVLVTETGETSLAAVNLDGSATLVSGTGKKPQGLSTALAVLTVNDANGRIATLDLRAADAVAETQNIGRLGIESGEIDLARAGELLAAFAPGVAELEPGGIARPRGYWSWDNTARQLQPVSPFVLDVEKARFVSGEEQVVFNDVVLDADIAADLSGDAPSVLVPRLLLTADELEAGVNDAVAQLGETPTFRGTAALGGQANAWAKLAGQQEAVAGGTVDITADVTSDGSTTTLSLDGSRATLALAENGRPVRDVAVTLAGGATYDPTANLAQLLNLAVTVIEPSTQQPALATTLTGRLINLDETPTAQQVQAKASYDLQSLLTVIRPLAGETLTDVVARGQAERTFVFNGPLEKTKLKMDASLAAEFIEGKGLTLQNIDVPLRLRDGVVYVGRDNQPVLIAANSGQIDLTGLKLDLWGEEARLLLPEGRELLQDVQLNPVFVQALGQFVNPVFVEAEEAHGLLNLRVTEASKLNLSDPLGSQGGRLGLAFSVRELNIENDVVAAIAQNVVDNAKQVLETEAGALTAIPAVREALGNELNIPEAIREEISSIRGGIPEASVLLNNGVANTKVTFSVADPRIEPGAPEAAERYAVTFAGDVRLDTKAANLRVVIPRNLIEKWVGENRGDLVDIFGPQPLQRILPEGVTLALGGSTFIPRVEVNALGQTIREEILPRAVRAATRGRVEDGLQRAFDRLLGGSEEDDAKGQ